MKNPNKEDLSENLEHSEDIQTQKVIETEKEERERLNCHIEVLRDRQSILELTVRHLEEEEDFLKKSVSNLRKEENDLKEKMKVMQKNLEGNVELLISSLQNLQI